MSSKQQQKDQAAEMPETGTVLPTRKARVVAGPCPQVPTHLNTRVYRTAERTRYCVCDDCGHTWKQIGPAVGEEADE